ncbi:MAG TPA: FAD-dependent oxidoreductase, partial [Vicinamibacterales bacterium]|nr:FAD-dependent oxidoreductase [Vicinamibacterales bacterium]
MRDGGRDGRITSPQFLASPLRFRYNGCSRRHEQAGAQTHELPSGICNRMTSPDSAFDTDVAIIGTGPYGLSAAAHLEAAGFRVRAFGEPMAFWANTMPEGMLLRSPRVASTIADPGRAFTLESYEASAGLAPAAPVPLSTFVAYGRWFQQHAASFSDPTAVRQVIGQRVGFQIMLADGRRLTTRRLVVAAGIGPFRSRPAVFDSLAPSSVSHCYEGRKIAEFTGKRVAVIGAGQSALESAALLHERGADVEIIARIAQLRWIGVHGWLHHLGPLSAMLYSSHDVGPIG